MSSLFLEKIKHLESNIRQLMVDIIKNKQFNRHVHDQCIRMLNDASRQLDYCADLMLRNEVDKVDKQTDSNTCGRLVGIDNAYN